jgi:hypothetical protein
MSLITVIVLGFLAFFLTFFLSLIFSAIANLFRPSRGSDGKYGGGWSRVDPLLFHPIVRSLCCCVDQIHGLETKTATEEEDLAQILTK